MEYFAGLDVSVKETSVCIVDDAGKIVREVKVVSEPEALLPVLTIISPSRWYKKAVRPAEVGGQSSTAEGDAYDPNPDIDPRAMARLGSYQSLSKLVWYDRMRRSRSLKSLEKGNVNASRPARVGGVDIVHGSSIQL